MADAGLRPFNDSGYEILDDAIGRGELVIWSGNPVTPRLGDEFLIECDGRAYDAKVEHLAVVKGGWSAKCRTTPVSRRAP
jgi:hypothetical protein